MKIVITEKELIQLQEYIEWFVKNPNPCIKCSHSTACCCICEKLQDWTTNRMKLQGYDIYKDDKVKEVVKVYIEVIRKRIELDKVGKELIKAEDAYNEVIDKFEVVREDEK